MEPGTTCGEPGSGHGCGGPLLVAGRGAAGALAWGGLGLAAVALVAASRRHAVHQGRAYDLEINTGATGPQEAATLVLTALASGSPSQCPAPRGDERPER